MENHLFLQNQKVLKQFRPPFEIPRKVRPEVQKPALFRVSSFRPFYGDYRILWLDSDYRHALVGGDDAGYLWILAREPKISGAMRETLLAEARRRGYDTSRLIWVGQE